MSDNSKVLKLGFVLCVLGGTFLYSAIKKQKRLRKIQDTQRSKVASAPQGFVEIEGFAWPYTETVNLSCGLKAVYHSLEIQRYEKRGKSSQWVTFLKKNHEVPFYVFDGTGAVLVVPSGCEFELDGGKTRNWGAIEKTDQERIIHLLGSQSSSFNPDNKFLGLFSDKYRVIENEIYVGGTVYIHGVLAPTIGQNKNVVLLGLTNFLQSVFDENSKNLKNKNTDLDKNRDGKISAEESQIGYATLAKLSIEKKNEENVPEKAYQVYGTMLSDQQHQLLIADLHERYLAHRLGSPIWLLFFGGALSIAIGVVLISSLYIKTTDF